MRESSLERFCLSVSAMVLASAISSSAFAADAESLPPQEQGTQRVARQCLEELRAFDRKLAEVGFAVPPPGGYGMARPSDNYVYGANGTIRDTIYSLRGAAYVYAINGEEKSCRRVLDSMRKTYARHQRLIGAEADDPNLRIAWRRAHLANARPVTGMTRLMRAAVTIGAEIRSPKDEKLGEIEDLVLDPAAKDIAYVLASRGGFLGFGEKLVAVRWSDLRATEDHELYVLDTPKSAFDRAPTVDRSNFQKTAAPTWRRELNRFWNENLEH